MLFTKRRKQVGVKSREHKESGFLFDVGTRKICDGRRRKLRFFRRSSQDENGVTVIDCEAFSALSERTDIPFF